MKNTTKDTIKDDDAQAKAAMLAALNTFARQRSGIEYGNYGDWRAFNSERRSITKDLKEARVLLSFIEHTDSITYANLRDGLRAYSGRLTVTLTKTNTGYASRTDYCTGQYFPTEYRRAVCAVAASAIWDWFRDGCMPTDADLERQHISAGDYIRKRLRMQFGRGIASRWFQ